VQYTIYSDYETTNFFTCCKIEWEADQVTRLMQKDDCKDQHYKYRWVAIKNEFTAGADDWCFKNAWNGMYLTPHTTDPGSLVRQTVTCSQMSVWTVSTSSRWIVHKVSGLYMMYWGWNNVQILTGEKKDKSFAKWGWSPQP
jgi:hypothetical protein